MQARRPTFSSQYVPRRQARRWKVLRGLKYALALLIAREQVSHGRSGLLSGGGQGGTPPESLAPATEHRHPPRLRVDSPLPATAAFGLRGTQSPPSAPTPGPVRAGLQPCGSGQRLCSGRMAFKFASSGFGIRDIPDVFAKSKIREKICVATARFIAATGVAAIACDLRKNSLSLAGARRKDSPAFPRVTGAREFASGQGLSGCIRA